jgi:hypothetical protein
MSRQDSASIGGFLAPESPEGESVLRRGQRKDTA